MNHCVNTSVLLYVHFCDRICYSTRVLYWRQERNCVTSTTEERYQLRIYRFSYNFIFDLTRLRESVVRRNSLFVYVLLPLWP